MHKYTNKRGRKEKRDVWGHRKEGYRSVGEKEARERGGGKKESKRNTDTELATEKQFEK